MPGNEESLAVGPPETHLGLLASLHLANKDDPSLRDRVFAMGHPDDVIRHAQIEAYLAGELDPGDYDAPDSQDRSRWATYDKNKAWHDDRPPCVLHEDCRACTELGLACAQATHPDITAYLAGKKEVFDGDCPCCTSFVDDLTEEENAALLEMEENAAEMDEEGP